ncbi:MAG: hypothetical protein LUG89_01520 [Methanosphaera sp.]|nr:hypothetical protein [Methanosphaera sp.]
MQIETSARLHLSLIDLNGSMGRVDGGIGITLDEPKLVLEAQKSSNTSVIYSDNCGSTDRGESNSKILYANMQIQDYLGISENYTFRVKSIYPAHQGLGLGTQLLLSTAKLVASMNNYDIDVCNLATITHRGSTSGIGVHSFNNGGIIIDGGHKKNASEGFLPSSASSMLPPPLIARYDFPKDWSILLVTPDNINTVHGKQEVDIFQKNTPISMGDVDRISYLTLMKLMPSVIEENIDDFASAVNNIQQLGFKKVECSLQENTVKNVLDDLKCEAIPCVGMSSFGPTCFGITDGSTRTTIKNLEDKGYNVIKTHGKNYGAIIKD